MVVLHVGTGRRTRANRTQQSARQRPRTRARRCRSGWRLPRARQPRVKSRGRVAPEARKGLWCVIAAWLKSLHATPDMQGFLLATRRPAGGRRAYGAWLLRQAYGRQNIFVFAMLPWPMCASLLQGAKL